MTVIKKVVRVGQGPDGNVYCKISFNEDGKQNLSISGVEGPRANGNAKGSCGQINIHEWKISKYAPGWSRGLETKFRAVWVKYHLNAMQAGTPAQTEVLDRRRHEYEAAKKEKYVDHFTWAQKVLEEAGLQPDNGYKYGSKWLRIEVPADVIEFLQSLPDTDTSPAWV